MDFFTSDVLSLRVENERKRSYAYFDCIQIKSKDDMK